ncbi:hypothetical protein RyT2_28820 [Pseudolactococcus yaeyamensis]
MTIKLDINGGVSRDEIMRVANKFDVKFDESYMVFLEKTNGGWNSSSEENVNQFELIVNNNTSFLTNLETMFGIGTEEESIEKWTEKFIEEEHVVAIGTTLLNALIIFIDLPELRGYYYYDDECNLEESDDDNNTYWLCETFDEFQSMVKNPE